MGFLSGIAGGLLGSVVGGLFNRGEADKNRDWQEAMSSTSHQREVADLKAAGLNPILSSKYGGSSTPSGAQATMPSMDLPSAAVSGAQIKKLTVEADSVKQGIEESKARQSLLEKQGEIASANAMVDTVSALRELNKYVEVDQKLTSRDAAAINNLPSSVRGPVSMALTRLPSVGAVNSAGSEKASAERISKRIFEDNTMMQHVANWLLQGRIEPIATTLPNGYQPSKNTGERFSPVKSYKRLSDSEKKERKKKYGPGQWWKFGHMGH